jgi:membrane protease YdiL (CAAX protease family)
MGESTGNGWEIVVWVVLIFVLTVLCALPFIIAGVSLPNMQSTPLFPLCLAGMTLVGFTPTVSALLVAAFFPGAGGARPLLRQMKTWHVGVGWYVIALCGPIVLYLLVNVVHIVLGGVTLQHWLQFPSLSYLGPGGLVWSVMQLILGGFGEELGWRGFGQPRLQNRIGALWASILIGLIWSTWHIWILITPGGFSLMSFTDIWLITYVRLTATAVIYAWIYNSTKGSLFLVMVAHAGHNLAGQLIRVPADGGVIDSLGYLVIAIVVVLMTDPQTLTRRSKQGAQQ